MPGMIKALPGLSLWVHPIAEAALQDCILFSSSTSIIIANLHIDMSPY